MSEDSVMVSVVIPTRNRSALLVRTLKTVLYQRDVELEAIIVDDASTDGTHSLVSSLPDSRIRLLQNHTRRRVSNTRNRGIAESRGEWVAFLDDDDLWSPDKLISQLEAARRFDRAWCYSGAVAVDEDLEIIAGSGSPQAQAVRDDLPYRNLVPAGSSNVIVRRATLDRIGWFDEDLVHMADWDLWIRLAAVEAPACVDSPAVAYSIHAGNASLDTVEILNEMRAMETRYAANRGGSRIDRAYVLRWVAWSLFRSGHRWDAVRAYGQAAAAGDPLSVIRALVAAVDPRRRPLTRRPPDPAWAEGAESWLRSLRK
jgi:glycosyltransferase involved in cell wall biosynthesis